jgi:methyltransferase (TIGR00027 family)
MNYGDAMQRGRASRTAQHNALFRALESARPDGQRLVADDEARRLLSGGLAMVPRLAAVPGLAEPILRYIDGRWPGVRTAVVARTRVIDDLVTDLAPDVEQLVILGAGFDTRAHRLPALRGLPVYEVDHPDTQALKRRALRSVGAPSGLRYVPCDFQSTDLATAMAEAGFDRSRRTLFLWEGTTNYLTEQAVDATLRWCAGAPEGSPLVMTYVHRDVIDHPERFVGTERLFATLEDVGERFTFGLRPDDETPEYLAERGFVLRTDVGAAQFREACYGDAAHAIRGHEFYRVATAAAA